MEPTSVNKVDVAKLERKVKEMYSEVALNPKGSYHFEIGHELAKKLGYEKADLKRIPVASIESFAGVGYYFDLAKLIEGEDVLDLGSGSGMDVFIAALKVGAAGHVTGIDMTDNQLEKAEQIRKEHKINNVSFINSQIEKLPFEDSCFDSVISNGVINLSSEKNDVFAEIARVLKKKGRIALSDIITEKQMPDSIVCSSSLWAA